MAVNKAIPSARGAAITSPPRRAVWQEVWRKKHLYLFLLPMLGFLLTFSYWPAFEAIRYSFLNFDGVEAKFIGLRNFIELFSDPIVRKSFVNLSRLGLFNIIIHVWMPFFAAELIYNLVRQRTQYFYRVMFVIPMVVPSMAVLLIWQFLYEPNFGPLNTFLRQVHLGSLAHAWLGDPKIALYAIMGVGFPWVSPFALLVYFAALQGISRDVIDASRVDGCSGLRRVFAIDIPMVLGQIKVILILQIIGTLQSFVGIMILTQGGPADATMVPGLYMYRSAFYYYRMGYASSIGVVLLVLISIFTYLSMRYRRAAEYGAE